MEIFAGVKHSGLSLQSNNCGCFGAVTLSIMTLRLMVFIDTQHNANLNVAFVIVILSVIKLRIEDECQCDKCRHTECRGARFFQ